MILKPCAGFNKGPFIRTVFKRFVSPTQGLGFRVRLYRNCRWRLCPEFRAVFSAGCLFCLWLFMTLCKFHVALGLFSFEDLGFRLWGLGVKSTASKAA